MVLLRPPWGLFGRVKSAGGRALRSRLWYGCLVSSLTYCLGEKNITPHLRWKQQLLMYCSAIYIKNVSSQSIHRSLQNAAPWPWTRTSSGLCSTMSTRCSTRSQWPLEPLGLPPRPLLSASCSRCCWSTEQSTASCCMSCTVWFCKAWGSASGLYQQLYNGTFMQAWAQRQDSSLRCSKDRPGSHNPFHRLTKW